MEQCIAKDCPNEVTSLKINDTIISALLCDEHKGMMIIDREKD